MSGSSPWHSPVESSQGESAQPPQRARPSGRQDGQEDTTSTTTDTEADFSSAPRPIPPMVPWPVTTRPASNTFGVAQGQSTPFMPLAHGEIRSPPEMYGPATSPRTRRTTSRAAPSSRPYRPPARRSHVMSACQPCRVKHLACDEDRPCQRCVTNGTQDTCHDPPHKPRGRPRIRPPGERVPDLARGTRQHQLPQMSPVTGGTGFSPYGPSHYGLAADFRQLLTRGHASTLSPTRTTGALEPAFPSLVGTGPSPYSPFTSHPRPGTSSLERSEPPAVAYLHLDDLKILRTTAPFVQRLVGNNRTHLVGRTIFDLVIAQNHAMVEQMRRSLKDELVAREPAYMPPPYLAGVVDRVNQVRDSELGDLIQGSRQWLHELDFVLPDGRRRKMMTAFRLARLSAFFIVMFALQELPPTPPRLRSPRPSRPPGFPTLPMPSPSFGGPSLASPFTEYPRSAQSPSGRSEPAPSPRLFGRPFDDPGSRRYGSPSLPAQSPIFNPWRLDSHSQSGLSSSSPEIPRPPPPPGPAVPRRRSEPQQVPSRRPAEEYPFELQLPPIRSHPEQTPVSRETGRKRSERETSEEASGEGGRPEGRQRKRQRVSVEEILQ
ncbi:MAG: hypothetical protein M1823_003386 [Watsoniomyces obsoletus]|nr:MAG: hypothetical protein M1823_003386 [Watsoniomyces obsoletus]